MNLSRVDQIAKAVLYEGYMLYPYRPSSVKNRQRWNFGVVYPEPYSQVQGGTEACVMKTEFLVAGSLDTVLEASVRFLQLRMRFTDASAGKEANALPEGWQEAVEREIRLPRFNLGALHESTSQNFVFDSETRSEPEESGKGSYFVIRRQESIVGSIDLSASQIREGLFKVTLAVRNTTPIENCAAEREQILMHSLVSTHVVLGAERGEFISLLETPDEDREAALQCQNVGVWPVLVGDPGYRDTLLASPIILYDYPQIAPESVGDLFDGTEIDEILSLRIMTLTEDEKREIRESDERARQILERTDSMPAEQFMKLHGAVRGMRPLKEGTL